MKKTIQTLLLTFLFLGASIEASSSEGGVGSAFQRAYLNGESEPSKSDVYAGVADGLAEAAVATAQVVAKAAKKTSEHLTDLSSQGLEGAVETLKGSQAEVKEVSFAPQIKAAVGSIYQNLVGISSQGVEAKNTEAPKVTPSVQALGPVEEASLVQGSESGDTILDTASQNTEVAAGSESVTQTMGHKIIEFCSKHKYKLSAGAVIAVTCGVAAYVYYRNRSDDEDLSDEEVKASVK